MDLAITPLPGGFGARVETDLARTTGPAAARALTDALHRHRVLVLPEQHLNHADLIAAASLFGTVDTATDRRYTVPGFPGLTVISNIHQDGTPIGIYDGDQEEEWHADNSFKPELNAATLLYSVITPAEGGETRFADATRAYADLPPAMRQRAAGMRAVHSIEQLGALQSQAGGQSSIAAGNLAGHPEVEHPLVLTHPATRTRSLLLGSMVISGITGLAERESRALLDELLEHTTSAPYLYSHRWKQGDLVVWDNLATLHTASPCDSSRHRRLLYRAAVR
ncbi:TauD/TfdA family dioxygenase [Streptomyces sp. NBC_00825]|uniref:TauD/TfdA dioxygenase family protein n=1 Tax=unclassified Streptomyces TaxID=2593676 RepID=UPI002ED1604A|nr:TauD/TfdA family dioxygenase [Streptomyces sp. NBC_00826]WTH89057.1 TauD/TfdA family dioxygenase [Streptomyces sp. NBC_00825]WTH97787.1 TauD/TfdA family dioxygenase [Streptomyces sp. NBC_00822]